MAVSKGNLAVVGHFPPMANDSFTAGNMVAEYVTMCQNLPSALFPNWVKLD